MIICEVGINSSHLICKQKPNLLLFLCLKIFYWKFDPQ